jgi:hypothetical protein
VRRRAWQGSQEAAAAMRCAVEKARRRSKSYPGLSKGLAEVLRMEEEITEHVGEIGLSVLVFLRASR